jgi:Putative metallopeptidase
VLHELAHAIFDLKKVPILGREEDAADQLAAYMLLQLGEQEARRTITSIAAMYASEAKEAPPKLTDFANEHGVPAQRLYNILCLSYGKDPKMFGDLVEKGYLPHERAELCGDEFRQVQFAVTRLIAPASKTMHKLARLKLR